MFMAIGHDNADRDGWPCQGVYNRGWLESHNGIPSSTEECAWHSEF
jgi:hypothetical protein